MDRIIDRRSEPKQKSLGNRRRFVERSKEEVRKAVADAISQGKVKDLSAGKGGTVVAKRTEEPSFQHDRLSGKKWFVFSGNDRYQPGDQIPLPEEGGGGHGSGGSSDGGGEDEFKFYLTKEEFLNVFFGDCKLPNMDKRALDRLRLKVRVRAGFTKTGSPATLDIARTMINAKGRQIGLGRPSEREIREVEDKIRALQELEDLRSEEDEQELMRLHEELARLKRKRRRVPFLEPELDPMHRHYDMQPMQSTQAVMFCLMDASASMTESLKDLAKRFFMLLHVFLERFYKEVHIVFIRHTSTAQEVDEETFFRGTDTGGTVISTAFEEMLRIIKERYDPAVWNIYAAQASDGDNYHSDMPRVEELLTEGPNSIMAIVQYFAYIETAHGSRFTSAETPVWHLYKKIRAKYKHFGMKMAGGPEDIFPVFRDLFTEEK